MANGLLTVILLYIGITAHGLHETMYQAYSKVTNQIAVNAWI